MNAEQFERDPEGRIRYWASSNRLNFRGETLHFEYSKLEHKGHRVRLRKIYDQSRACQTCAPYSSRRERSRIESAFECEPQLWVAVVPNADLGRATRDLTESGVQYCAVPIMGDRRAVLTTGHLPRAGSRNVPVALDARGSLFDCLMILRQDGVRISSSHGFLPPQRKNEGKSGWTDAGTLRATGELVLALLDEFQIVWTQTGQIVDLGILPWDDARFEAFRAKAEWLPPQGWIAPSAGVPGNYQIERENLWMA